jgi:hypothetical protein
VCVTVRTDETWLWFEGTEARCEKGIISRKKGIISRK